MGYFDEVYLKRVNKDGTNQQDRVKTRKEREFDLLFLKKTEYLAYIHGIDDEEVDSIACSLQPNKWNESHLIANMLVSTATQKFHTGQILSIRQKIKEEEQDKLWLIIFVEDNMTKGYQLYKMTCLDSWINLIDEYGTTLNTIPVKFVNLSSNFVQDTFVHSHGQYGYREPQALRSFITADFDFLKKGAYFEYKKRGWELQGFDNLSIDNVCYATISERLVREEEPMSTQDLTVDEDNNFFLNGVV